MRHSRSAWLFALALLAEAPGLARTPDPRIDRIFAQWDRPGSPGCALGVVRNGVTIYTRGYGSANLEHGIANTPATVFDIGSVSKAFTAMSVVLLAQDGKLGLDDEIHRFVPELPDYGTPISLRQMLHHASGLPSYTDLFDLAGVPEASLSTDADALRLIARQKTLNFAPGQQYLYSDTNYFLLSLVVQRVSGQSLREFAAQRIFKPLGMRNTHFHDDHTLVVLHRATGHAPRAGGGFAIDMSNFEELGDGSVMTSVEDMLRWDRNFRDPVVGGRSAIDQLQAVGIRSDGTATPYALGLIRDRYRGHDRVQHTGEWVGYRAGYARFPNDGLSVILLCNVLGDVDTLGLIESVADRYLGPAPLPPAAPDASALAGIYWDPRSFMTMRFAVTKGTLGIADGETVTPLRFDGANGYTLGNSATRFEFARHGETAQVTVHSDDSDPVILDRVAEGSADIEAPRPVELSAYAGTYYSEALGVSWTISVVGGRLMRSQWLLAPQELNRQFGEVFQGDLSEGQYTLRFDRGSQGEVTGFAVATTMVKPLTFRRCAAVDSRPGALIGTDCRVALP